MSLQKFKEILNEILLTTADIKKSAGIEFNADSITKMAIAVYLQSARDEEKQTATVTKPTKRKTRPATKKQIQALKKIYGSLQKVRELAGVDSLYDLDVSLASQLITNGNGRK